MAKLNRKLRITADATGTIIVTLWEEKIDLLEVSQSYKLTQFIAREFNMMKSLSLCRHGSIMEEIDDIGTVQEDVPKHLKVHSTDFIENADIIVVKQLASYSACVSCKGRVDPLTPPESVACFNESINAPLKYPLSFSFNMVLQAIKKIDPSMGFNLVLLLETWLETSHQTKSPHVISSSDPLLTLSNFKMTPLLHSL